jgi:DNA-binding response OmpR family regulator
MGTRIMVVDDTQELLDLFQELLSDEGYEVVLNAAGIQDVAEVERVRPGLIILDHIIDGKPAGLQMELQLQPATAAIPVIVCTAASLAPEEMEGYLQAGGVRLVLKPFDVDELLQSVQCALAKDVGAALPGTLGRD